MNLNTRVLIQRGVVCRVFTSTLILLAAPLGGGVVQAQTLELGLSERKIHMFQSEKGRTSKLRVVRGGWTGPVTVVFSGLPAKTTGNLGTAVFNSVKLSDQQETAWLTLETYSTQKPGTFPLTVKAYGNGLTATETIELIIMAPRYRTRPVTTYKNYYTSPKGNRCEFDVTAEFDLTVDFTRQPAEIRLKGDLVAEAVGNTTKCNGGSSSFSLVNTVSQEFPYFSSVFSRYGSSSGKVVEIISLSNGRSSGKVATVQLETAYVREGGSGGTFVPINLFLGRVAAPQLDRAVEPPGAGEISVSDDAVNGYQEGQLVSVNATPASGFEFQEWRGALSGKSPRATVSMSSDKKIQAVFRKIKAPDVEDKVPPSMTFNPRPQFSKERSFALSALVSDDRALKELSYRIKPPGSVKFLPWRNVLLGGGGQPGKWGTPLGLTKEGRWEVEIQARDTAGNKSKVGTMIVIADQSKPTAKITSAASTNSRNYALRADLADRWELASVRYRLKQAKATRFGAWTTVKLSGNKFKQAWSSSLTLPMTGAWQIELEAIDAASNVSKPDAIKVNRTK